MTSDLSRSIRDPSNSVRKTGVRMVAERFLTIEPAEVDAVAPQLNIVLNWYQELLERVLIFPSHAPYIYKQPVRM